MDITLDGLKNRFKELGYNWYDFQLIGIRSKNYKPNTFTDKLILVNGTQVTVYNATTRPGRHWLLNLLNPKGTAVLKPGQYVNTWRLGIHKNYKALVQVLPVEVYRDKNRNEIAEISDVIDRGIFGINIHRANQAYTSTFVDKWSAGCQVVADPIDFSRLLKACEDSGKGVFTYTLLNE